MLYVGSIKDIKDDMLNLVIVRSLKNEIANAKQVAELAPPKDLFYDYLNWRNAGQWTKAKFDTEYVPRFLNYLHTNQDAIKALNYLYAIAKSKDVRIVCFCIDESMCHRSIIAGLLRTKGIEVVAKTNTSYSW